MAHIHKHNSKNLLVVFVLTVLYMIAEYLGGLYTNSLALIADAGHMLGDVGALGLSFFALWISKKPAPIDRTFGYFRAEIIAAFINGIALVAIAVAIFFEAYSRIIYIQKVSPLIMIFIATGGLIVNIIGVFMLHQGSKENLNIKGAFLHIIGDLLGSIGAIIAGLLIYYKDFYLADPIISIIIASFVLYSSINLILSTLQIFMEAAPKHIDIKKIKEQILNINNVEAIHDLHVWSISSNYISLSVHVVSNFQNNEQILHEINNLLIEKFNILHSTIQIEPKDFHEHCCPFNHQD